ncbi:glutathione S-transferase [Parasitella parasitica]|nr:glutathione S-transferase [Parasitella parasitica]
MVSTTTELKNIKLHYFTVVKGSTTMGRGEFIRLLLEDAGIDFEYIRHTFAEWKDLKQELIAKKIPAPTMPYITVDGKYFGKTIPVIRYICRKLGKYEGSNDEEKQLLDVYLDIVMDWASSWSSVSFGEGTPESKIKLYKETQAPNMYKVFEDILSNTEGPYLLGKEISYADFLLYHMMEDDGSPIDAASQPHLSRFVNEIEKRPNMAKYFATDRK